MKVGGVRWTGRPGGKGVFVVQGKRRGGRPISIVQQSTIPIPTVTAVVVVVVVVVVVGGVVVAGE